MAITLSEIAQAALDQAVPLKRFGRVRAIEGGVVRAEGLGDVARIGARVGIGKAPALEGDVVSVDIENMVIMPDYAPNGISPGDPVMLLERTGIRPCEAWIGNVLSADGMYFYGGKAPQGEHIVKIDPDMTGVSERRGMGERVRTGLAAFDTFLPICKGQRLGLFAGSGVGKSTLISQFANGIEADLVIAVLIGERSREVREFADEVLGEAGRKRSIVFASTCDQPAALKRRCAHSAIATAEYFRDQGKHVLVLFDSITRYADAHREVALTAGEIPSLRAYPPSTFRAIASLAERTGPGGKDAGDITAIFSVLVAGSDMEEPIADMVRGILDGHVVLDRSIAERGRFPAIDVRRSVSRSLPGAATHVENGLLNKARRFLGAYDDASAMIRAGLYVRGSDSIIDRAIDVWPSLDAFIADDSQGCRQAFDGLSEIVGDTGVA